MRAALKKDMYGTWYISSSATYGDHARTPRPRTSCDRVHVSHARAGAGSKVSLHRLTRVYPLLGCA